MTETVEEILRKRDAHVAPSFSVHYRQHPVHVVRGEGQYLYDADGTQYLDCINNVALVGHGHPRVVAAISQQLGQINTNTRFLYEPLADYAERLSGLLPERLSVCFFVNSGSEANELALRLARAHTGRRGVVVLDHAYHGNTSSLVDISPYKFAGPGGAGRPGHVQVAATPDPYRGPSSAGPVGQREVFVSEVGQAFARAAADRLPAGLFIAEPVLGCAGQIQPPQGYLKAAFELARASRAVATADEVQIGFGRLGPAMWGFATQGALPDIVTMGKPIGNGFPLGAVVTTPEIAASFDNGMEYFNTFGGSPAACAAGLAVLDVLRDEGLPKHAEKVGSHLLDGFRELANRHEAIGDVRGRGLFLGVDLVVDRGTREPASALARRLVSALREEAILVSTEGPGDNVLKLKPPLPFSAADADRLLESVDRFLDSPSGYHG